ncbi:NfeD family protein [Marinilactibacillus piezotolerans]|uniref:NfeD family protein n=1 Tax=Marinilactibacillus piezotolerans TaxID=258723 RepID=UPI0009B0F10D|nr:NfeD family protein [Marinilactibacillus piezotolerans]
MEGLLLAVGFIGVVLAILTPLSKTGLALTLISFTLYFSVIGVETWLPIVLFTIGLLLIVFEIFIPEFGLAGALGTVLLIVGLYLTIGDFSTTIRDFSLSVVLTSGVVFYLIHNGYSLANANKLILNTNLQSDKKAETTKKTVQITPGLEGIAQTPLRPSGKVSFGENKESIVDVLSSDGHISKDTEVIVEKVMGTKVVVKKK